jgi:hypothetical protein
MSDIFQKTTLGYEEIVNRSNGLPARMRRCLIMVDGKRSLSDLIELLKGEDISPLIQTLEIEGYIQLLDGSLTEFAATALQMSDDEAGQTFEDQAVFTDSKGKPRQALSFAERKLRAMKVIHELLGPNADNIALEIEACKDSEALGNVLHTAASFLSQTVNPVAAKRFKDHVRLADIPA